MNSESSTVQILGTCKINRIFFLLARDFLNLPRPVRIHWNPRGGLNDRTAAHRRIGPTFRRISKHLSVEACMVWSQRRKPALPSMDNVFIQRWTLISNKLPLDQLYLVIHQGTTASLFSSLGTSIALIQPGIWLPRQTTSLRCVVQKSGHTWRINIKSSLKLNFRASTATLHVFSCCLQQVTIVLCNTDIDHFHDLRKFYSKAPIKLN